LAGVPMEVPVPLVPPSQAISAASADEVMADRVNDLMRVFLWIFMIVGFLNSGDLKAQGTVASIRKKALPDAMDENCLRM
jgi:hypothetical protein